MRFNLLARRIAAPALGLALAATMAACSSPGSSTTASPSSAPPSSSVASSPASGSSPSAGSTAGAASGDAKAQITSNWEAFFDGKTSAAKKISLLENGQKFASVINAQAGSGLAASAGAKVKAVAVNSPAQATVNYDITLSGATALPNQTGTAVYQDGMWKVGDVSFCQLLKIENGGTAPSVCS
ncbi:MAG TPA: hypothetical protein VMK84_00380 [Streptosporangiaceae bacterium]|nr:hypothetical protein [Streptosporangiaceae bacterium]